MGEFAYVGSVTLAAAIPLAATAQANLDANLALTFPEINAKIAGAVEAQAQLTLHPPSLQASLDAALAMVANLQAMIALGMPSGSVNLTAIAALIAELNVTLGALEAQASFSLSLGSILATGGVSVWTYSGDPGGLVPGWNPGGTCWGVVMAATASASITAMQAVFGVSS